MKQDDSNGELLINEIEIDVRLNSKWMKCVRYVHVY